MYAIYLIENIHCYDLLCHSRTMVVVVVVVTICVSALQWLDRWPVNSPHKGPVTRKIFPFDDVIMGLCFFTLDIVSIIMALISRVITSVQISLCFVVILSKVCYRTRWRVTSNILNTLRPRENGRHFPDDAFNRIFVYENIRISIKFSLKFVPKGPIHNIAALVLIMAWRRPGDKPLSGPMMVRLPTHICVTRPQWVKTHISVVIGIHE